MVLRWTRVGGMITSMLRGGHLGGEPAAGESLVQQQRVDRGVVVGDQVGADLAFIDGGRHQRPGADDAAAQVGADGQAEAVEPFGVRAVAAEPGGQVVAWAGPLVRAADPGGVLDRERGGVDLLDRVGGDGCCPGGAELLEGAP